VKKSSHPKSRARLGLAASPRPCIPPSGGKAGRSVGPVTFEDDQRKYVAACNGAARRFSDWCESRGLSIGARVPLVLLVPPLFICSGSARRTPAAAMMGCPGRVIA